MYYIHMYYSIVFRAAVFCYLTLFFLLPYRYDGRFYFESACGFFKTHFFSSDLYSEEE